jgi:methylmalonyl-CoA mutase
MSKLPDFANMEYDPGRPAEAVDPERWRALAAREAVGPIDELTWRTGERIDVKPLYTAGDIAGLEHLGFTAGIPPFLGGPYATMYVTRPWTVRQYSGFSTAEESNAFYRRNLAAGQRARPAWPWTRSSTPRSCSRGSPSTGCRCR